MNTDVGNTRRGEVPAPGQQVLVWDSRARAAPTSASWVLGVLSPPEKQGATAVRFRVRGTEDVEWPLWMPLPRKPEEARCVDDEVPPRDSWELVWDGAGDQWEEGRGAPVVGPFRYWMPLPEPLGYEEARAAWV